MKRALIIIMSIFIINTVYASTVHGTIYDLSLDSIKNIIIEINSMPAQKLLSKDGTYLFQLSLGNYNITAKTLSNKIITQESIEIKKEGDYLIDLFEFPDLSEENNLTDIENEITDIENAESYNFLIIPVIVLVIALTIAFYLYKNKKIIKNEDNYDDLTEKIISIIKESGNRTTQKEIRKKLPFSEAKISLVISELEAKGKIEKIKKGRGNIIILKN